MHGSILVVLVGRGLFRVALPSSNVDHDHKVVEQLMFVAREW